VFADPLPFTGLNPSDYLTPAEASALAGALAAASWEHNHGLRPLPPGVSPAQSGRLIQMNHLRA
jgi:hypothetical protein